MKKILLVVLVLAFHRVQGQELFVYSEPASNMPAHTVGIKLFAFTGKGDDMQGQRYIPEVMFGLGKKFMLHSGLTFSNMYSSKLQWESLYVYGKYRFLSRDDVHQHFRAAAYARASYSRNFYHAEEVNIWGDRSGIEMGLIATQLVHKFAASATISHTQAMDPSRTDKIFYSPERVYQSINYSLSTGLLLLPTEYKTYRQLNLNVYAELLGQKTIERGLYYIDFAPALQLIFNSNSRVDLGYRFELSGNETRSMNQSFLFSFEHTFFNRR